MFAIPATGAPELEAELNHFLRSHRVVSVKKSLEIWEENPRWCFCVEYMEGPAPTTAPSGRKPRIDYREVLSEEDFAVFARLRDLRRELTADGTAPVYTVCTNENLAQMAKQRPKTLEELKKIEGLGDAKAEKYGKAFLKAIAEMDKKNETSGKPDPSDRGGQ